MFLIIDMTYFTLVQINIWLAGQDWQSLSAKVNNIYTRFYHSW